MGPRGLASRSGFGVRGNIEALLAQPIDPWRLLARWQIEDRIESGKDSFVARQPGITRTFGSARIDPLVGVAEERRSVACAARCQRDIVETRIKRCAIRDYAIVELIGPRVEAGATGSARRGLAVVPREMH